MCQRDGRLQRGRAALAATASLVTLATTVVGFAPAPSRFGGASLRANGGRVAAVDRTRIGGLTLAPHSLRVSRQSRCQSWTCMEGNAVKTAPFQYLDERDACGVGFIADRAGSASHNIVSKAVHALGCMEHRGACGADSDSGDGAGLMTGIPWELFSDYCKTDTIKNCGVGMIFLPQDDNKAALARKVIEETMAKNRLRVLGWRKVPVKPEVLGELARANQPQIEQIIVRSRSSPGFGSIFGVGRLEGDALEKQLYLVKRSISTALAVKGLNWWDDGIYVCSLSSRTIVYKGMVRSVVLDKFYTDLTDPLYKSQFAIYHRRFSTNTMPRWPLAQPFRTLGHNGEINTLLGNINWMRAREAVMDQTAAFPSGAELSSIDPLSDEKYSDSANLDAAVELLIRTGKTPMESLMIMVPEAYRDQPEILNKPEISDFYDYYAGMQESWDGPALLVFSDGKKLGATLDRNGLRPARYFTTTDGLVCMMSETGVVPDIDDSRIDKKGRLGPGQMIALDLETGKFYENFDIKSKIAKSAPYGDWLRKQQFMVKKQPFSGERLWSDEATLVRNQVVFGWSSEDMEMQIADMASTGKETTFCMGDDTPLAVLSEKPHVLFNYFKQRFAQVTNPAIDPLRESIVMSLDVHLGAKGNAVEGATESKAGLIKLESPVVNEGELQAIQSSGRAQKVLSTLYDVSSGPAGLKTAVEALCQQAEAAVRAGTEILILTDLTRAGISPDKTYIPPLLAVGAVHHHLLAKKLRLRASIISQTAQCWSTHHVACLIGYGASAVHPYAALEGVRSWYFSAKTKSLMEQGKIPSISVTDALENFRESIDAGLLKIMSKIGISLLSSYHAAQIFEAIGVGKGLIDLGFKGTVSRVGGLTVEELANEINSLHRAGFPETPLKQLQNYGFVKYYTGKEYHHNSPPLTKLLHKALETKDIDSYKLFQESLKTAPLSTLRDLLDIKSDRAPIPLDQVQPLADIMQRFCTGGMSLGALSREAHETLAISMNRFGGKSNSGEGGEDVLRFSPINDVTPEGTSPTFPHLRGLRNGDIASSKIKQVASGRFGVHPEYLMSAEQIEIKLAQGAKPGEGGQLPGAKIDKYIASLRLSKPGVTLISPPPHHDIYSIEDLAQLIYDLHQINPTAKVSVKLVAGAGIGTIAAGVAKANADVIQISGHDGGTGASPLSSIKHAGVPWELGLTEVHRTLLENRLRGRVLLRVDGGLKTGWDIVMAALAGGEEYGFGTIAMIAEGCIMARICHTNNCPVGVTTQKEALRKKFPGTPEAVVNYFTFVGEEVRSILAHMGYSRLEDVIGRADLLKPRAGAVPAKTIHMDLSFITDLPDVRSDRSWVHDGRTQGVHSNGPVLDDDLLKDPALVETIARRGVYQRDLEIINTDRSVGARVSGVIAKRWGNKGFASEGGKISLVFRGSAGQSFGAFTLPGMRMEVVGEVNDYCGKGIHGGEIIIRPPEKSMPGFVASENVIVGNTALYGATGGHLFAAGRAGERFAVRNSACRAVCEGTGDHALEYMTGGVVVVLGPTGRNVAAGMTGGLAYVLEETPGALDARLNKEIVQVQRVRTAAGEDQLKGLIQSHVDATGSEKGRKILDNWGEFLPKFWQIVPPAEAKTPEASDQELEPSAAAVPVAK